MMCYVICMNRYWRFMPFLHEVSNTSHPTVVKIIPNKYYLSFGYTHKSNSKLLTLKLTP